MKQVFIKKAAAISKHESEDTVIVIDGDIEAEVHRQGAGESLASSRRVFDAEAESLFIALRDSLPGGTIDHLIAKLLTYKASHFVVNHEI